MNANVNYRIERNIHRTGVLLSVIIPSHNAEKTLRRAVESVVRAIQVIAENATLSARKAQEADGSGPGTAPLCEILVIENESEDGTAALALELQAEHPDCLSVLHSKSGVSYARNRGLEAARGEWILFLDADDYLTEGAGEVLRDDLHFTGTDLIAHSYESGDRVVNICAQQGERFAGGDLTQACVRMIENPTRYTSVWSKLFRRERIEYAHLRFDTELRESED
ncbi:MAG: glycosyltransferase family 2 protein, partial [Lachnospiraceae bacterium]|nr:glycosyltransferase family 2 protein [Lachnospiraceae bacterium]